MQQTMKRTSLALLIGGALCGGLINSVQAADVPAGVQLARQQNIVINNGSEVASLDPHKVEGVPESNVILNLLEGLVSTDATGIWCRRWPSAGKIRITATGPSICAPTRCGATVRR